jgi:hypothetical protein
MIWLPTVAIVSFFVGVLFEKRRNESRAAHFAKFQETFKSVLKPNTD